MFQLPIITQDEHLECSLHHKPLEKITWKCKQSIIVAKFLCEECPLEEPNKIREFEYRTYADEKTYSISFLDLPPVPSNANTAETTQKQTPIDFRYCQVEHIIIDEKTYGYTYKSLVYIPDKQILIACNPSGTLSVWSVAGSLNFIGRFNVGKPITWGEYIDRGNKGKHLVLGILNEIYVYNIEGSIPIFLTILKCKGIVWAIDFISSKDQIVSVGYDSFVSVWNLKDWSLDRTINTKSSKKLPLMSVIYIEKKNILAVQDNKGVYFLPFEKKKTGISQSYKVEPDHIYGLAYLPQHQEFILRSPRGIHILDESLSLKIKYVTFMHSSNISNSKFLINQDETQILSSTPSERMTVSQRDGSYLIFPLTGLIKEGPVLELMRDQHRFVLADNTSGRMFILRTNVPKDTGFVLQGSFFENSNVKVENMEPSDIVKEEPMVLEKVKNSKDFFANNETRANIFEEEQKQGMEIEVEKRVKANRSQSRKRSKDKETAKEGSSAKNQSKKKTIGKAAQDKNEDRLTKDRDKSRSKERKGKKTTKHG